VYKRQLSTGPSDNTVPDDLLAHVAPLGWEHILGVPHDEELLLPDSPKVRVVIRNWQFALALLALLLACGCADNTAADKDRPGGFYGGVSAGGVMH